MASVEVRPNVSVGDRDVALTNEIYRVEVGSGVHGMAISGLDDLDLMGVYVETKEQLIGLQKSSEHYVSRTVPEGVRSGPGDIDLTLYSLRKFVRLATDGNPTILTALFVPESAHHTITPLGRELQRWGSAFLSLRVGRRYLGYLDGQRNRMLGIGPRVNRVPNRPELIERYGYDTKYASHALRLGMQGIEVVHHARLSLPLPWGDLRAVMEVKRGEVDQAEALRRIDAVRNDLAGAIESGRSPLRAEPDMALINDWLVSMHERHWA